MKRLLLGLLLLMAVAACRQAKEKQDPGLTVGVPESVGFSSSRLALLDSSMNNWVKQKWLNGSVALVARRGKIVFHKAYGYNDPVTMAELDKNGIFRIASQTKAITTVAAMMLWEEGKFALDDPVSKYIPTYKDQVVLDQYNASDTTYTTVPAKRAITIRDLLTHTSGLGYPGIGSAQAKAIYAKNNIPGGLGTEDQKLSDAMTRLGTLPLLFQPGEEWMYGLNIDLLGYLIELWSGQTLETFFTERIFEPLGMKDTYFNVPPEKASRLVNFFLGDDHEIKKQDTVLGVLAMDYPLQKHTYFSGGGGLSSTITDYAVFLQMLLNKGTYRGTRLLAHNTVRLMTMNQIGDLYVNLEAPSEYKFGFGFALVTEESSRLTPSQAGTYSWGGIFSTSYWVDPKEELIVLLYRQMWGPHIADTDQAFKPLVYQAIDD